MSRIEREVLQGQEKTKLLEYYRQMLAIRRIEEALGQGLLAGQDRRLPAPLHRAGGGGRRAPSAAIKPEDYIIDLLPRPRPGLRQGHVGPGDHGRAVRQGDRLLEGPGRLDALLRRQDQLPGRLRHRRRPHAAGGGRGLRLASTAATGASVCASSATAPSARAPPTRRCRWPRCGSCRWCSSARTTSTRWARRSTGRCRSQDVSQKALAYGMARDRFDGNDVIRVRDRIAEAVRRARYESQPTLIEIRCYRFRGHSMSDPGLYRTKEEVEEYKKQRLPLHRPAVPGEAGRRREGVRAPSRRASRPRSRTP